MSFSQVIPGPQAAPRASSEERGVIQQHLWTHGRDNRAAAAPGSDRASTATRFHSNRHFRTGRVHGRRFAGRARRSVGVDRNTGAVPRA
jgi:hypothetical protein